MMRIAVLALILGIAPVLSAEETPEDAYAACVIGKAAVLMHYSADVVTAAAAAWDECATLKPRDLSSDDGEGLADFVYATLEDIAD